MGRSLMETFQGEGDRLLVGCPLKFWKAHLALQLMDLRMENKDRVKSEQKHEGHRNLRHPQSKTDHYKS